MQKRADMRPRQRPLGVKPWSCQICATALLLCTNSGAALLSSAALVPHDNDPVNGSEPWGGNQCAANTNFLEFFLEKQRENSIRRNHEYQRRKTAS